MHDENDFLRKLTGDPTDDTVRLVYADWLGERGDGVSHLKATFLRLTIQLLEADRSDESHEESRKRMQPLAAKLPTEWLAVISRLKVEGCGVKAAEQARSNPPDRTWDPEGTDSFESSLEKAFFEFVCDKRWDEMTPTRDVAVRRCEDCKQNVHYCDTLAVAREHAEAGRCIAVDLGVTRREDDLSPPRYWLG